ncbi:peptidoglycan-binding domain-containing protein [Chryseobacterium viscerum]|uniref:Peptidoglycan-binding protein n=1 Tax=Chryseobacterium viscerum TaxID=1037377 RepID=A0A5N4BRA6_9FLAO|nr:peptidoglycan-binding domain-containing protein [Chryseobacterium viscerum]KAB1230958.1 peptidoglycan-binding protein [Chryseobacterium viscerum]
MSRLKKTFAPRAGRSETQIDDNKEDEKKYEQITDQDSKISLAKTEVTQITYPPFRNRAFNKIEKGSSRIQFSNSGLHVLALNKALNALGHKVPENEASFGDTTKIALINFQKQNGITGSGIFDKETLLKMNEVLEASKDKASNNTVLSAKPEKPKVIDSKDSDSIPYPIVVVKNQKFNGKLIQTDEDLNRFAEYKMKITRPLTWKPKFTDEYVKDLVSKGGSVIYTISSKTNNAEKEVEALSPAKKQFIRNAASITDYIQNIRILDLLKQLSEEEIADYKSKVSAETANMAAIEESLKAYIKNRNTRNQEKTKREKLQEQLAVPGLEILYKQYTTYIKFKSSHKSTLYEKNDPNKNYFENALNKQLEELLKSLNAHGFTLSSFEKLITNYELAFRKETVHIAEDALIKYRHVLFEQKKKLLGDVFITNLLGKIKASKAKESYEDADKASGGIYFADNPSTAEIEFKVKMEAFARSKKTEGNAAIKELSSTTPLVEDNGFNKEGFAKLETKQALRSFLERYINDQEGNITKIITSLNADQGISIYGYGSLLQKSKEIQGIAQGSIFDLIIADKESSESTRHIINGLLIGALAVALGLLSFGTGTVAVLLAAGNFALGAYITYEEIEAYRTQLAAYKVDISQDEPSAVWIVISVVGSILDAAAVAKISAKLINAGRTFELTKDIGKTEKELAEAGLNRATREKVIKALEKDLARIEALSTEVKVNFVKKAELKAEFHKLSQEFVQATATLNMGINPAAFSKLTRLADLGIKRGITTFEGFLLELKLNKIIKSVDNLTDEELKIIKEAFSKAKNGDKVSGKVDDLYREIDVNHKPKGFESLEDIENFDPKYGRGIITKFDDYEGYFYRNYDAKKKIFTFNHGFSNDLPKWVEDVKVPLVQGKGIPTQAYFTLRQMKLLSIAEGEIQVVKMSQIQNLDTAAFIFQVTEGKIIRNFDSIDILAAPSNGYMKTVMTQAGYETISGRITGKGIYMSVKQLKAADYPLNPKFKGSYEAFMKEYGLSLDSKLYLDYNIEIKVKHVK